MNCTGRSAGAYWALVILTACTSAAERQAQIAFCMGHIPDQMFETNSRYGYEGVMTECLSGRFGWKLTAISGSKDVQRALDEIVRLRNTEKAEQAAKADSLQRKVAGVRQAVAKARVDSLYKWSKCELAHVHTNTMGEPQFENLTTDCYSLYPSNGDSIFYGYINPQTFSDTAKIRYLQRQSRKVTRQQ